MVSLQLKPVSKLLAKCLWSSDAWKIKVKAGQCNFKANFFQELSWNSKIVWVITATASIWIWMESAQRKGSPSITKCLHFVNANERYFAKIFALARGSVKVLP